MSVFREQLSFAKKIIRAYGQNWPCWLVAMELTAMLGDSRICESQNTLLPIRQLICA